MDPNQAPVAPPQTPTDPLAPQSQAVPVAPVAPIAPAPTAFESVAPPIAPIPVAPQPPQSFASTEVFGSAGSAPQPVASVVAAYPSAQKSSKKIIAIVAAIIVGLGVLGTAAWLLIGVIAGSSITLKEYSGDKFSILVPENYEQDILSSSATFTEPDVKKTDEESKILVQRAGSVTASTRDTYIKSIDSSLTEDKLNAGVTSGASIANMKVVKSVSGDNDIRTITADVKKDGAQVGTIRYLFVIGEDNIYLVVVAAHISDPGLAAKAQEITDSFKLK